MEAEAAEVFAEREKRRQAEVDGARRSQRRR
jgi:hypothetical protein